MCRSYTSRPTCYYVLLFYTTMSECMIFYGPTVPEINYSSSSSSTSWLGRRAVLMVTMWQCLGKYLLVGTSLWLSIVIFTTIGDVCK